MEGPTCDKENIVSVDISVLCIDGRSFNQRKQIALDTFCTGIGRSRRKSFPRRANLVDFIDEHNSTLFNCCNCALFKIHVL
mmetsp:Transcript_96320/g.278041  ORF Transcript_96320/g.278041 Transcript_96320/m.278041 type:complete len:81 (-) Transcript_96320:554-796(-)